MHFINILYALVVLCAVSAPTFGNHNNAPNCSGGTSCPISGSSGSSTTTTTGATTTAKSGALSSTTETVQSNNNYEHFLKEKRELFRRCGKSKKKQKTKNLF